LLTGCQGTLLDQRHFELSSSVEDGDGAGWAIAGIFELGAAVQYGLMAVFSLAGLYVMAKFVQMADKVEPIRG
jgi:hypothetical protein